MVPLTLQRIQHRLNAIARILESDKREVEACLRENAEYPLRHRDLGHLTIIDFDSFLFESRSTYEVTVSFIARFFELILGKPLTKVAEQEDPRKFQREALQKVEGALKERGADTNWIEQTRQKRNLLIHARAAWLALKVNSVEPLDFSPVFLTRDVENLEDDPDRFSFDEFRGVWRGFVDSYEHIEAWLKDEITTADQGFSLQSP